MLVNGLKGWFVNRSRAAKAAVGLAFAVTVPAVSLESAVVERSVVVREHAGWSSDCEAIPHPPLSLITPPSHGTVCAKAEVITVTSIFAGRAAQCVGRKVSGVRLIYQPDASFDGDDAMFYGVQYPGRFRAISVKVNVGESVPSTVSSADADVSAQWRQAPGPVPPCPEFAF
ncbi:MAG TPA: hypothetical protein VNR39_08865 [Pseudolabrys sp.]|nr:hypothetical protein [Pseudolabrys sp.]